ncbi:MAG TPA: S41 family peptidase [Gemmatimonadales bacterium]|nr:S41 family peptidase [Gemmatimonadales bacterium]
MPSFGQRFRRSVRRRFRLRLTPNRIVALAFAGGAALASGAWMIRPAPAAAPGASAYAKARVFEEALTLLRAHAVDTLNEGDLYLQATEGVVKSLHDPWAALLVGDSYDRFRARLDGIMPGVGLEVETHGGALAVARTVPGSPAQSVGLSVGDRVIAVDDSSTLGWSVERLRDALRGPAGSVVRIVVERAGGDSAFAVALKRAPVREPAVRPGLMLGDGIGYLAITAINHGAADDLSDEIDALAAHSLRGLVIDLRGNPGGLVQEGARIAELFLDPGQISTRTQGREREIFRARRTQRWPDLPLAVLVDGSTASAAEVVAAALQDHDRALILGTATFGKGVVQRTYPLSEDAALRFTTARWYAPSGRWIQRGSIASKTAYTSDAGRPLPSGVGVVPDTIVLAARASDADRVFGAAVGQDLRAYDDALAAIATHLVTSNELAGDTTTVTPRMRAMLFQRLQGSGLHISGALFTAASAAIDRDLGAAMVRAAYGSKAALKRRLVADDQVEAARAILVAHPTPRVALMLGVPAVGAETAAAQ